MDNQSVTKTLGIMSNRVARALNLALGVWLFISAFLWMHTTPQHNNAWIVGLLSVLGAVIAFAVPQVRFANTLLAIWLFISIWALPRESAATSWNSALVAIAIFIISLAGPETVGTGPSRRRSV